MSAASGRKRTSPSDARRIAASGDLLDPVGVCVRIDHVKPWCAIRAVGGAALVFAPGSFTPCSFSGEKAGALLSRGVEVFRRSLWYVLDVPGIPPLIRRDP